MRKMTHVITTAGAGKTTKIKQMIESFAFSNFDTFNIENTLYLSFTKLNVESARQKRVLADVRTIHSFAYHYLQGYYHLLENPQLPPILNVNVEVFNKLFNYNVTPVSVDDPVPDIQKLTKDDMKLACLNYSINADVDIETAYEILQLDKKLIKLSEVKQFVEDWQNFKSFYGYIDFNDLLLKTLATLPKMKLPIIKMLAIDEAQDLSPLMWKLVDAILENAVELEKVIIVGDDDQTIYTFMNASNVQMFLNYPQILADKYSFDYERIDNNNKTHRCPVIVFEFAKEFLKKIKERNHTKSIEAYKNDGSIDLMTRKEFLQKIQYDNSNDMIAILERHNHNLSYWKKELIQAKIPFLTKENLWVLDEFKLYEKILKMLDDRVIDYELLYKYLRKLYYSRTGERLKKKKDEIKNELYELYEIALEKYQNNEYIPAWNTIQKMNFRKPRVILSTIHAFKGEEADTVFVGANWTKSVDPVSDEEKRVYFVASTRTRKTLVLAREDLENFNKLLF